MKKIALVVTSLKIWKDKNYTRNGGNTVTQNIVQELLKKQDVILDIFCINQKDISIDGVNKIYSIDACGFDDFVSKVSEKLNSHSYDLVLYIDLVAPKESLLIQAHSIPYRIDLHKNPILKAYLKHKKRKKIDKQNRIFANGNKKIFVVSESLIDDYSKYFNISKDRFVVAYPGVVLPEKIAQKSNIEPVFGISAGSNLNKGADKFILALYKLKLKGYKNKAKMICPKYQKLYHLRLLINLLGLKKQIEILDIQTDMTDFYNSIDIMVMPSMHEGFGLVALEAAAHDVFSIVSSNSGISDLIRNGENGLVFEINNSPVKNLTSAMCDAIKLCKSSEYSKIKNNLNTFAKIYTWEKFVNKIIEGEND